MDHSKSFQAPIIEWQIPKNLDYNGIYQKWFSETKTFKTQNSTVEMKVTMDRASISPEKSFVVTVRVTEPTRLEYEINLLDSHGVMLKRYGENLTFSKDNVKSEVLYLSGLDGLNGVQVLVFAKEYITYSTHDTNLCRSIFNEYSEYFHLCLTDNFSCMVTLKSMGGYAINIDKNLLKARSQFFCNLFNNTTDSATENEELTLFDNKDVLLSIVQFIVSDYCNINGDNVAHLIIAANKFLLLHLESICSDYISRNLSGDSVAYYFYISLKYNLTDLMKNCVKLMKKMMITSDIIVKLELEIYFHNTSDIVEDIKQTVW